MDKKIGHVVSLLKTNLFQIVLILIVLTVSFGLYKLYFKTEEGFGKFYDTQTRYAESQKKAYWDNMNLQLDYNAGLEKDMETAFPDAVKNIDPFLKKTKTNNLNPFFRKDPIPGNQQSNQVCSKAKEPSELPAHIKNTPVGCGWWYIDDQNQESFGSRGTDIGPLSDLMKESPTGKWIWDLAVAQKMEDTKQCRKIKSCAVADLLPGKCGFCNMTGAGIPVDRRGAAKYPDDQLLVCPEEPIINPNKCPKPVAPLPVTLPDGTVVISAPLPALCDPVNGRLTLACLISLATAVGCSEEGAIVDILKGDSNGYYGGNNDSSNTFKKAVEILATEGKLMTESAFLGKGVCDRDDALDYYKRLVKTVTTGKTTRAKAAARFLTLGSDFDPCDYDLNQEGPFELYCLQRLAREKGCQPDGSEFPTSATQSKLNRMTWAQVNSYFAELNSQLKSPNQAVLEHATKKCLGITVQRKQTSCGNKTGCEVLWYSWDYEWDFPDKEASTQIFYGREIKPTLPYFNTGGGDFNPYNILDRISFRLRTNFISNKSFATKMWVMTDDGVAIKVNDKMVQKSWRDQGPTAYETTPFTVSDTKPTKIEAFWYENYGGATFIPKLLYEDKGFDVINPSELKMNVASDFPLCRWDFYEGSANERNKVLTSNIDKLTLGVVDGKKAAIFGNGAGISIVNQVRGAAFASFIFMIYHKGGWARLFALRKGSCNSGTWNGFSIEGGICADSRVWFALQREGGTVELWLSTLPNTIPKNAWFHLAYVIDADYKGITIYADNMKIGRMRNEKMNGEDYKNTIYNQVTIGHAAWGCNGPITPPPSKTAGPAGAVQGYQYKGCWADSGSRAISNYSGSVKNTEECYQLAKSRNATVFGLQNYGECWTGTNKDYDKYGKRDDAGCGPLGKDWTNQVYTLAPSSPPDCPPSVDGSLNIGLAWVHWFDYTMNADEVRIDRALGFTDAGIYPEERQSGWRKGK